MVVVDQLRIASAVSVSVELIHFAPAATAAGRDGSHSRMERVGRREVLLILSLGSSPSP